MNKDEMLKKSGATVKSLTGISGLLPEVSVLFWRHL